MNVHNSEGKCQVLNARDIEVQIRTTGSRMMPNQILLAVEVVASIDFLDV